MASTARTRAPRSLATVTTAAALLALTACSGGSSDSEGADSGGASAEAPAETEALRGIQPETARGAADSAVAADEADSLSSVDGEGANRVALQTELFIRTGKITVESTDLDSARAAVNRLVERFGGHVSDERTENEDDGKVQSSRLTLRVPSESFSVVMAAFGDLGTVQGSTATEENVTTEVIDVASRIRTQEVSLRRLRGFLDEARTVEAIIRLESEIARREADLASLRAQQDYLEDQTSLSTIELTLRSPSPVAEPSEEDPLEDAGFLTGLRNGWNALLDVLVVTATVIGAVLPFLIVLVVLGIPISVAIARARSRSAARAGQGPSTA